MLKCPVCGTENGDLDTVCRSCKGFIQAKVDTLDLFSTAWGLMDQPRRTFRRIALAKTKNYVILLSAGIGIALVYLYFWHWHLAVRFPSLITLLGIGLLVVEFAGDEFFGLPVDPFHIPAAFGADGVAHVFDAVRGRPFPGAEKLAEGGGFPRARAIGQERGETRAFQLRRRL